jgi:hypothetical protein
VDSWTGVWPELAGELAGRSYGTRSLAAGAPREKGKCGDPHHGDRRGGVTRCSRAMARNNRWWWSSMGRQLERGWSEVSSEMEPGKDGVAHGVLYIGCGTELRGPVGRAVAGGGFSLPVVSVMKWGEESTRR